MTARTLTRYTLAGVAGAVILWGLTSLFVFAFSPEMGTP